MYIYIYIYICTYIYIYIYIHMYNINHARATPLVFLTSSPRLWRLCSTSAGQSLTSPDITYLLI